MVGTFVIIEFKKQNPLERKGNVLERIKKVVITLLYGIGTAVVLLLLVPIVTQSRTVLFPDSMLPTELRELALEWLAMCFLPMSVITYLFRRIHGILDKPHRQRNMILIYIPALICALCALFWICVLTAGFFATMGR